MERVVHRALSFADADRWDVAQHRSMTPEQRLEVARRLKERAFPANAKDVREWHRPG
jgi:hypothetical protein